MKQFEYKIVDSFNKTLTNKELNALGSDGWELCSYLHIIGEYIFRREVEPQYDYIIARPLAKLNSEKLDEYNKTGWQLVCVKDNEYIFRRRM